LYAEHLRDHLVLECQALLSDEPEQFASPLAELSRLLMQQLAPASLHPLDSQNALLRLERAFADGVAELERAGYRTEGISVFDFFHRLSHLELRAQKSQ
jgi:hypothetical protein